jgi:Bacterial Ig-like domain
MMQRNVLLFMLMLAVLCLGACGDDEELSGDVTEEPFALKSTIPRSGANGVDITSSVVFHFNRWIDSENTTAAWAELFAMDSDGAVTLVESETLVSGSNVICKPTGKLSAGNRYMATVSRFIRDTHGAAPIQNAAQMSITFKTGGGASQGGIQPVVAAIRPADSADVFDWTTFHIDFSEPIESQKTIYGDQILLRKRGTNSPVPSQMFLKGTKVTIDPDSDLIPGESYELLVLDNLRDAYGDVLAGGSNFRFEVMDSNPRVKLVFDLCPTRGGASGCDPESTDAAMAGSMYTVERTNSLVMESRLFGRVEFYLSGLLEMEVGNMKIDSSKIPVVMRKGQRIFANPVSFNDPKVISDQLAADQISLILLSDAHGFITDGALGEMSFDMEMNFGMNSKDQAQNALTGACMPSILLSGQVAVDSAGRFRLETAGYSSIRMFSDTVELTFSISALSTDENLLRLFDNESPRILSSYPKNYESHFPLGKRLSLIFNEPIDPVGIGEQVALLDENNVPINGRAFLEASVLHFVPSAALQPNTEHRFILSENVSDLLGNRIGEGHGVYFKTGPTEATSAAPLIATMDPPPDSIFDRPGNLPVTIHFTQLMDKASIILGNSIRIQDAQTGEDVPGVLDATSYDATFWPNEGFDPERAYRLTISDEIRNYIGVKLDLGGDRAASPDESIISLIVFEFRVSGHDDGMLPVVFQINPATDADGSGLVDPGETPYESNRMTFRPEIMFPAPSHLTGQFIVYFGPIYRWGNSTLRSIFIPDGIRLFGTSIPTPQLPIIGAPETGLIDVEIIEAVAATMGADEYGGGLTPLSLKSAFSVEDEDLNEMFSHEYVIEGDIAFAFDEMGRLTCAFSGKGALTYSYPIINFDVPLSVETALNASSIIK